MSLTEAVVKHAWEKIVKPALEDTAKRTTGSLLGDTLKKLTPTRQEQLAKSLLGTFAQLLTDQFEDHALLTAETAQFEADAARLLENTAVQGWLAEPLDPEITALDPRRLAGVWNDLALTPLPADFGWNIVAQRYLTKVRNVIRQDPELRDIDKTINLREIRDVLTRQAGLDPGFRLTEYRDRIRSRFGSLKFDSFHVTGSDLARQIQLTKIFVPQTVKEDLPPLELPKEHIKLLHAAGELSAGEARALASEDELQGYRSRYQQAPQRDVSELLLDAACPHATIIGDPGSGKSTLLEWLLLRWAEGDAGVPFPLFVELRQCARQADGWHGDLCQYFATADDALFQFNAKDLDRHLKEDDSVLLVDGLDEVFDPNQRKALSARVLNFKQSYPRARIVVTSRIIGFQKDAWLNGGFRLFTIQDFDQPQIVLFLDRWHSVAFAGEPAEIERLKPRLLDSIRDYTPIRELAANPLLLTMMAVINRMEPIPRDRRALYERCAELLLHRWDVGKGLVAAVEEPHSAGAGTLKSPLDLGDKKTLLELIAHAMQSGPAGLAGNVIGEDALKRIVTGFLKDNDLAQAPGEAAREIIHQLRGRNFILCALGADRYAFVHRTFLEFFCARYFSQRLEGSQILEQVVKPHWNDERWHEVIRLLVAEKAKQPEVVRSVIGFLLEQKTVRVKAMNVFLAADCVLDLRNPADLGGMRGEVLGKLEACFGFALDYYHDPWGEEQELVDRTQASAVSRWTALQAGAPGLKSSLKQFGVTDARTPAVRLAAIQELARGWNDDPDVLPLLKDRARQDENWAVRQAAIRELARGWKDDPDLLPWLKDRASQDENRAVRQAAIQELARGWKDDPDLLPLLKDRARQDSDNNVRQAAIQEWALCWKDDPDLLPWLKDRARQDENWAVRQAAIQELARRWKDDAEILPLLKDRAFQDRDGNVQRAAIRELARGWKDDSEILPLLKDLALNDQDEYVRYTAIQEVARGWKDHADILPWLKERALLDQGADVRQVAIQEVARGWKDYPDILPWLKSRAHPGQGGSARHAAIQELARRWKNDPDILPLLMERARQDPDGTARRAAIQELARGWEDHPDILSLLNELIRQVHDWPVRPSVVHELARGWKDRPDILPLLKDLALNDLDGNVKRAAIQELACGWKDNPDVQNWLAENNLR